MKSDATGASHRNTKRTLPAPVIWGRPGLSAQRFVTDLLRECFGFSSLEPIPPVTIEERLYRLDTPRKGPRAGGDCAANSGLMLFACVWRWHKTAQCVWSDPGIPQRCRRCTVGLCTDGVTLRIARDNASLTRPAWIEADLADFSEESYADFAALWLLIHETRFGRPSQPVTDCALELIWRQSGREQGTRAREQLREGVEDALLWSGPGISTAP